MANKSAMQKLIDQLIEVSDYRDTDPRRARYLRERLYVSVLEKIAQNSSATPRDEMVKFAQTALQAEEIDIAPFARKVSQ